MYSNLLDVIKSEEFNSLDDIQRFNKTKCIKSESVTAHSNWVTILSIFLVEQLQETGLFENENFKNNNFDLNKFKYEVVLCSCLHDFDESLVGDILFDVKYNSYNGKKIKAAVDDYVEHKLSLIFDEDILIENLILKSLSLPKEDFILKFIIKMADWFSCIKFELSEIKLGNIKFIPILEKSNDALNLLISNFTLMLVKSGFSKPSDKVHQYLEQYINITSKILI